MNRSLKYLTALALITSFFHLYSDDTDKFKNIDQTINYSAQPVENPGKECLPLVESYQKHVFEARYVISTGKNKYAENKN